GASGTVIDHVRQTLDRLGGSGVRSSKSEYALLVYLKELDPPRSTRPLDMEKAERGRAIFASAETGCSACHAGDASTNGYVHDVGSSDERGRVLALDTPSLRFVGRTAPYFHDGRYATLRELLVDTDGTMGQTGHLSPGELDALETYLQTL